MADPDLQVWGDMLTHLRNNHPAVCRQWFEELEPIGIASGSLQLRSKSPMHRDYLRRECADSFNDAIRSVTGRLITVRFLGPDDEALAPQPITTRRATPITSTMQFTSSSQGDDPHRADVEQGGGGGLKLGPRPPNRAETQLEAKPESLQSGASAHAPQVSPSQRDANASQSSPTSREPVNGQREGRDAQEPAPRRAESLARPGGGGGGAGGGGAGGGEERRGISVRITPPTRYESLVVNPDYCFENFVVGPGNRMAHAAAMAIAVSPGRTYNPFFVHAGVGLGKTHLLQAVCLRIAENNPGAVMHYTSCEGFVTQYFESVQNGEMSDFRHRFRDVDVLVIDDIHFLAKRETSQEEFFHTFNALFQANKQIILSCDAPPEEIPALEERLVSRFKWGLVTKIEAPIFETRVAILKTKAQIRGLNLPDDVACFIAGKLNTNIRELEGAIVKLHIQSIVEQRPIDMNLAKEALGDSMPQPKGEPTLQAIISAVTEFYGVRLTDLQSKGRQRSIALPRQVCMFLARRCTRHSLEEIGGFFGGRDHTTVMHAVETVEEKCKADAEFDLVVRSLEERVRAPKAA